MQQSYQHIRCHYGEESAHLFKSYSKDSQKLARFKQSKNFLIQCRTYGLIPKFIIDSTSNSLKMFGSCPTVQLSVQDYIKNLQLKLLNFKIKEKHIEIRNHEKYVHQSYKQILDSFPSHITSTFFETQKTAFKKFQLKLQTTHEKKFNTLKNQAIQELGLITNTKWFDNRTSVQFPSDVQLMLSLGKKFSLPYDKKNLPLFQIIADGEFCLQTITEEHKRDIARAKLSRLISDLTRSKLNRQNKLILKLFDDTIKFLASCKKDVIITSADKGGVTVALWREDYLDKMNSLTSDRKTYWPLRTDITSRLQAKNNEFAKYLHNNRIISDFQKYKLTTYKALPPKLYGLPKIHKENCPVRPIVSSINSPVYELSKYLANTLKHLTQDSKYNVKNSFSFKDKINNITIEKHEKIVSFDVISLFTNIPINLCLKTINKKWDILSNYTDIPRKKFLEMLKFCIIDANYFVFGGKFFKQTFGVPMGSPLSPILADIVLEELLDDSVTKMEHKPKILLKYVDDLFSIVADEHLPATIRTINSFHKSLQFTVEEEVCGMLPYLDTKVIRDGCKIILDWYQKPTSSGRLLHYRSSHPRHQIINTAKNFISKVLDISHQKFHEQNIKKIKMNLSENGFPKAMVKRLLFQHKQKRHNNSKETRNCTQIYKKTTYIPGFSEKFNKILSHHCNEIKTAPKTQKTIRRCFSNLKDGITKEHRSNAIYKIPCKGNTNENCQLNYVGTTGQFIKNRIAGHKSDLKNSNKNKTALSLHCALSNHTPDFENIKILHTENNNSKRLLLESLYIQSTENTMNRKTDTENISSIYCALLENCKSLQV